MVARDVNPADQHGLSKTTMQHPVPLVKEFVVPGAPDSITPPLFRATVVHDQVNDRMLTMGTPVDPMAVNDPVEGVTNLGRIFIGPGNNFFTGHDPQGCCTGGG